MTMSPNSTMTTDEFALRLIERLHSLDFWVSGLTQEQLDAISEEWGTPKKTPEEVKGEPEVIDLELVDLIASYIVEEEELNPEDEDEELEFMLRLGNFIYGWEHWKGGLSGLTS